MAELRRVNHPGPVLAPRVLSETADQGTDVLVTVPAGEDLFDGLAQALALHHVVTAGARIVSAHCDAFAYVTGVEDPTGYRVATFSETKYPPCPVELISGHIIVGRDEDGSPKTHCHAIFKDARGKVHAGHLLPGECTLGREGAQIWASASGIAGHKVCFDDETNFPIFHPAKLSNDEDVSAMSSNAQIESGHFGRIITARVRPNEDLVESIETLCASEGITQAEIRSCVGSLMDANLAIGAGDQKRHEEVKGPGLEITISNGVVRPDDTGIPRATLRGLVANGAGEAYAGEFVPGRNLVFVTLEVVLQEWVPDVP